MAILISKEVFKFGFFGLEERPAELLGLFRVEEFAAENLDESAILSFIKMKGNRRSLNKLHGRIAQQISLTKFLNQGLAKSFHFNSLAKFYN